MKNVDGIAGLNARYDMVGRHEVLSGFMVEDKGRTNRAVAFYEKGTMNHIAGNNWHPCIPSSFDTRILYQWASSNGMYIDILGMYFIHH